MNQATYEANSIESTNYEDILPSLDKCCKRLISSKQIVARIMQAVIPEYVDCTVDEIIPLIGKVSIGDSPVDKDIMPIIVNEGTEDSSINEGTRLYDIKFTAITPQNETIAMIINIEIQNNFNAGYPLIKRAEYYVSRMISSQCGTVFTGSDYGKIQKVYSVWICTGPDKEHENTISIYKMNRESLVGKLVDTPKDKDDYGLMNIVMICLGDSNTKQCRGIIRMLYTLLVADMPAANKKKVIHDEYSIPMEKAVDEEVEYMCNLSSLYIKRGELRGEQRGEQKRTQKLVYSMYKNGIPTEQIAIIAELSTDEVKSIIKSFGS